MCERAAMSVLATLCKRCGVLRHTSDHDSHNDILSKQAKMLYIL